MSLCATYVKADDGLYYKNPTIRGANWFICFDDDDPPELVLEHVPGETPQEAAVRAKAVLAGIGIVARLKQDCGRCRRYYGTDVRESRSWFLKITEKIPASLMPGVGETTWSGSLEQPGW